ncbi:hypothetical protein HNR28_002787 [Castellaniella defragrans]|uniref:Uncharacterized protein n=1 Tax=Castellaniella defragrans TaxID=75697 RepID=A0A7W9WQB7_CASDE|nr:hypothetical protein [Castellaniella defragrans]
MSRILGPGPYKTLTTHDGIDVPFYIVRFDKKGLLQSPETAKEIISVRRHDKLTPWRHGELTPS